MFSEMRRPDFALAYLRKTRCRLTWKRCSRFPMRRSVTPSNFQCKSVLVLSDVTRGLEFTGTRGV